MKILFNIIATGIYYDIYAKPLIKSIKEKLVQHATKDFLVFSNNKKLQGSDNFISHFPWPVNTLMRFYYMSRFVDFYKKYDFVYYIDSDMLINETIGDEILPDESGLVGVHHPLQKKHLIGDRPCFEDNKFSTAYLEEKKEETYFQGCLFGGTNHEFIKLISTLDNNTSVDLKNNIIAKWHDESHLNWYFNTVSFPKVLSSDYCYPEAFPNLGLSPKILHLDKNK
jgi:hypothetical protein